MLSRCASAREALTPMVEAGDANARLFLAEVRGLQAYYNMLCLDLWGIAFQKDDLVGTKKEVTAIMDVIYAERKAYAESRNNKKKRETQETVGNAYDLSTKSNIDHDMVNAIKEKLSEDTVQQLLNLLKKAA